jgi:dihydrofolate reductase
MSLDGFIAAAGHVMDWGAGRQLADFVGPDEFHKIAAATGAMLVGRRTSDVGDRMEAEKPGSVDYPFSGPVFVLTHRPPQPPNPGITYLTGDIGEAVATARGAAGGKNLEILGADVAAQCLQRDLAGNNGSAQGIGCLHDEALTSRRASEPLIKRHDIQRCR